MKIYYLFLLSTLLTACNITGKIESTGIQSLSFGTGGGFTNEIKTYTLLSDGALWLHNSLANDSTLIKQVSKNKVNKLFGNALALGLDTLRYSNPGNTYTFITTNKKGVSNKIVWSAGHARLPDGILSFYNNLKEISIK